MSVKINRIILLKTFVNNCTVTHLMHFHIPSSSSVNYTRHGFPRPFMQNGADGFGLFGSLLHPFGQIHFLILGQLA